MSQTETDPRPPVWVGHIVLATGDVAAANEYWTALGMRPIESHDGVAVLELRGGTHLVLLPTQTAIAAGTPCPFDLMVEDVDAAHASYEKLSFAPSEIQRGDIHDSFTIVDPSGYVVTVNSSHVSDQPV
jgi:catechol 2,3-dioxygenase-like lactoylglutathione lyase family enzyme